MEQSNNAVILDYLFNKSPKELFNYLLLVYNKKYGKRAIDSILYALYESTKILVEEEKIKKFKI